MPIGGNGGSTATIFIGKYNGNGYAISNLKGSNGLFGIVTGSLTGIHLRDVSLTNVTGTAGSLANSITGDNFINLCSATGSITAGNTSSDVRIGGLIGEAYNISTPYITCCNADVDIDATQATGNGGVGGFTGYAEYFFAYGCGAAGNVTGGSLNTGGFIGQITGMGKWDYCMATGNVTGSTANAAAFAGNVGRGIYFNACYAKGTVTGGTSGFVGTMDKPFFEDCAYTGTQTATISGITGGVAEADLYATITATNFEETGIETLHWSTEDGYTLTPVTQNWYAIDIWKDNGTVAPTLNLAYEGWDGKYEGQTPSELAVTGQTSYWVAPVDAQNAAGSETMTWDEAMADGVCPKGWHIPTRDELDVMFGSDVNGLILSSMLFGHHTTYWTTTEVPSETDKAYYFVAGSSGEISNVDINGLKMSIAKSDTNTNVRCVRRK